MANEYSEVRSWVLFNVDSDEEPAIKGQFEPLQTTEDLANKWAQHTGLGRSKPILQFINLAPGQMSFRALLYALDSTHDIVQDLNRLKEWRKIDPSLGRPPILSFYVGDRTSGVGLNHCVLEALSGITYSEIRDDGKPRRITLSVELREFAPFDIEEEVTTDTRYHKVKQGEYFEMLTWREYRSALLGDAIRQDHPQFAIPQVGDVVKLPSIEGVRDRVITQKSIPLKTAFGKKETAQRANRLDTFDRRGGDYFSEIITEG
jgi:hypothetical protein